MTCKPGDQPEIKSWLLPTYPGYALDASSGLYLTVSFVLFCLASSDIVRYQSVQVLRNALNGRQEKWSQQRWVSPCLLGAAKLVVRHSLHNKAYLGVSHVELLRVDSHEATHKPYTQGAPVV